MCGIRGNESSLYYIRAITQILNQSFSDYRLILSGCCLSDNTKLQLRHTFSNNVDYHFIDDKYPVTVTFNHACLTAIEKYGYSDGYLYIDSGCIFNTAEDLQKLYDGFKAHPNCGMFAAQTDSDTGYHQWFGLGRYIDDHSENHKLFIAGDYKIPVGKTCNLHTQVFSSDLVKFYGRPYVDIFASHYSETVFTFVCAAIGQSMWISSDVVVHHELLDGQSSGYSPVEWKLALGKQLFEHPYIIPSILERVASDEAVKLGLGYGELSSPEHPGGLVLHDVSQFDDMGNCVNSELKTYIKNNLYLNTMELNYADIVYEQLNSNNNEVTIK